MFSLNGSLSHLWCVCLKEYIWNVQLLALFGLNGSIILMVSVSLDVRDEIITFSQLHFHGRGISKWFPDIMKSGEITSVYKNENNLKEIITYLFVSSL